jgi:hypothetical protein
LNTFFEGKSSDVLKIYQHFSRVKYEFDLTSAQWEALDSQFEEWLSELTTFIHKDTASVVKRLGLIQFRIAMVLSILRHYETNSEGTEIICSDRDFKTAQILSDVYLNHSLTMFFKLPRESSQEINRKIKLFYDALPEGIEITREKAVEIGIGLTIRERTVGKYLHKLVAGKFLTQPGYGKYLKQ